MNVELVVIQGKPEGKEIPLRTPKFLIGRGTECHLRPISEIAIDAVPAAAAAAAAQPEPAITTTEPAAVAIASARLVKLGRKDAKDSEIEQCS